MAEIAFVLLVVAAAAVYLATFVATSGREGNARAVGLAAGLLTSVAAFFVVLFATFVYALRCDENCNENLVPSARTPGWRNTIHAWQWDAQWALAIAACAAVILATALTGLRKRRVAVVAAAVGAICAVAWAVLLVS